MVARPGAARNPDGAESVFGSAPFLPGRAAEAVRFKGRSGAL